jgi:hypothetical protein
MNPLCNRLSLRQATRRVTQLYDQALPKLARELADGQPRSFVIRIVPGRTCRGDTVHDRDRTPPVAESK